VNVDEAPVTNDQAPVSDDESAVNDEAPVSEETQLHAPHIQVLKGSPTDADVAALVAVLGSAVGGGEPPKPVFSQWGMPVDKLRYSIHSWQRMSLQQRTHMRGK
jgi:hypothetical protein